MFTARAAAINADNVSSDTGRTFMLLCILTSSCNGKILDDIMSCIRGSYVGIMYMPFKRH